MTDGIMTSTNDVKETLGQFLTRIAEAKVLGHEWLETTPEIIAQIMPKGTGPAGYFVYQNVKVCEHGKSQQIENNEHETVQDKNLKGEGITIHGGKT